MRCCSPKILHDLLFEEAQGWAALAAPLEGDYETALAPEGCFGVLVNNRGRAAWMVHRASSYDKSGLAVFVR